jgi:hypothetical protein
MSNADKKYSRTLLNRHQPLPGTAQCQLNPKRRRQKEIDFPGLDFLQVARGNFRSFGQLILGQTLTHSFAADVRAENFDSLPFFSGNSHDILHRGSAKNMNDTYIVKSLRFLLAQKSNFCEYGRRIQQAVDSERKNDELYRIKGKRMQKSWELWVLGMLRESLLQFFNQIPSPDAEGLGDPQKGMKANPLFATLHFADINRMQIRFFRQFFLTQLGRFAILANGFAKNFKDLLTRHSLLGNHCRVKLKTPNMGLFSPCASVSSLHE